MKLRYDRLANRHPLELEFRPHDAIMRLNKMKNILAPGNIVNDNKLH